MLNLKLGVSFNLAKHGKEELGETGKETVELLAFLIGNLSTGRGKSITVLGLLQQQILYQSQDKHTRQQEFLQITERFT